MVIAINTDNGMEVKDTFTFNELYSGSFSGTSDRSWSEWLYKVITGQWRDLPRLRLGEWTWKWINGDKVGMALMEMEYQLEKKKKLDNVNDDFEAYKEFVCAWVDSIEDQSTWLEKIESAQSYNSYYTRPDWYEWYERKKLEASDEIGENCGFSAPEANFPIEGGSVQKTPPFLKVIQEDIEIVKLNMAKALEADYAQAHEALTEQHDKLVISQSKEEEREITKSNMSTALKDGNFPAWSLLNAQHAERVREINQFNDDIAFVGKNTPKRDPRETPFRGALLFGALPDAEDSPKFYLIASLSPNADIASLGAETEG